MKRIDCINKITTYAARFVLEVEGFNATGQYHINIHAENFLVPVLNEVFNLQLENLNATQKKNFPVIDLADFNKRVAFQITSTASAHKIYNTLQSFFDHQLNKHFDTLYFYILTEKREKYAEDKINEKISDEFSFNIRQHIVDKDSLLERINAINSTARLEYLAKLFEHEFSDVQIDSRKTEFLSGYLVNEPENLYPNLLPIAFPKQFYIAKLQINEEKITDEINEFLIRASRRPVRKIKTINLIKHALRKIEFSAKDWILHENALYTFRNLNDPKEPLCEVIDLGTLTATDCKDFFNGSENSLRVFKHLLRNTLTEYCHKKGIEWFEPSKIFRFANNREVPNKKRVKWKGKNESTKTVIFEIMNKNDNHIICYRHLAFKAAFEIIGDAWFLCVSPTWSFTNPMDGYRKSRFESGYMSGLKRLENNATVYNYFRFFGYHLTYLDLFSPEYPYLKIDKPFALNLSPSLQDKTWKPVKTAEKMSASTPTSLESDNELNLSLFES